MVSPIQICAPDDDRTIVVAMVDFAKTANLVFYIVKNYLLLNLSSPTVLVVELPNFDKSFLMVSPIQICAPDDDRTIVVDMVDFAKSANLVFYIVQNYLLLHQSPPIVLVFKF